MKTSLVIVEPIARTTNSISVGAEHCHARSSGRPHTCRESGQEKHLSCRWFGDSWSRSWVDLPKKSCICATWGAWTLRRQATRLRGSQLARIFGQSFVVVGGAWGPDQTRKIEAARSSGDYAVPARVAFAYQQEGDPADHIGRSCQLELPFPRRFSHLGRVPSDAE